MTIPDHTQRHGSAASFACLPDKDRQEVHVLFGTRTGLPLTVDVSKCNGWTAGNNVVRKAIADEWGIASNSFGFHHVDQRVFEMLRSPLSGEASS